ncbi:hypothetical protein [Oceaniglobus roseus]|uniref:hypothetical protein n=1 Tax=Oceaniglobus roseus TaxID=1737570 RepID=UPI000C7F44E2|nr:hypothetical protein [Kandeliimicrobium roseum]
MAGAPVERPADLGLYQRKDRGAALGDVEVIAIALSALWLAATAVLFLVFGSAEEGPDSLRFVVTILAMFMPVALIWVAATVVRSARTMREESERLHVAVEAMRLAYLNQQKAAAGASSPDVSQKLNEIAEAQKKTESALAMFISVRNLPERPAPDTRPVVVSSGDDQPSLALGTAAEDTAPPLNSEDFISALQFPESPEDKEGFRALRRALQDRRAAQLIQAAQDILTLLAQEGIYMDDLRPDRARPEIWRKFANGERGRTVASLGGIRDRSSLALAAARMRSDTIFRDAAHHFLRKFDHTFAEFEKTANDAEIAGLTDTRTARAFMLLGRVTGTFD